MHKPVLLQESVEALDIKEGETLLDGTLGGGGHAREVLRRFPNGVRVVGLDQDPAVASSVAKAMKDEKAMAGKPGSFEILTKNFRNLDEALDELGIPSIDAILLDLGFSSDQLEDPERGLSFRQNGPLDMRLAGAGENLSAADILNNWDEKALELILRGFGEERHSKRIAKEIVERRETKPFKTTFDLVEAVEVATPAPYRRGRIHPATRTFQALRIAVNDELEALEEGLEKGFKALNPGGRFAVISFHSLEDRIVKNFFKKLRAEESARPITKKPIAPTADEVAANPRARSAKLRVIEKI